MMGMEEVKCRRPLADHAWYWVGKEDCGQSCDAARFGARKAEEAIRRRSRTPLRVVVKKKKIGGASLMGRVMHGIGWGGGDGNDKGDGDNDDDASPSSRGLTISSHATSGVKFSTKTPKLSSQHEKGGVVLSRNRKTAAAVSSPPSSPPSFSPSSPLHFLNSGAADSRWDHGMVLTLMEAVVACEVEGWGKGKGTGTKKNTCNLLVGRGGYPRLLNNVSCAEASLGLGDASSRKASTSSSPSQQRSTVVAKVASSPPPPLPPPPFSLRTNTFASSPLGASAHTALVLQEDAIRARVGKKNDGNDDDNHVIRNSDGEKKKKANTAEDNKSLPTDKNTNILRVLPYIAEGDIGKDTKKEFFAAATPSLSVSSKSHASSPPAPSPSSSSSYPSLALSTALVLQSLEQVAKVDALVATSREMIAMMSSGGNDFALWFTQTETRRRVGSYYAARQRLQMIRQGEKQNDVKKIEEDSNAAEKGLVDGESEDNNVNTQQRRWLSQPESDRFRRFYELYFAHSLSLMKGSMMLGAGARRRGGFEKDATNSKKKVDEEARTEFDL